ncbi:MAG TPA: hypothetical protein VF281_02155 [Candidatus Saccharimonadales bacterium]
MTLSDLFESFQVSAFRLEGLPTYAVPDEGGALRHYKAYGQLPVGFNKDWAEFVKEKINDGKVIQRLRLLSSELTEYEQFELHVYKTAKNGEDIRFSNRANYPYTNDFWLFDNKWLARMNYDDEGRFIDSVISEVSESDQKINYWMDVYAVSPEITKLNA